MAKYRIKQDKHLHQSNFLIVGLAIVIVSSSLLVSLLIKSTTFSSNKSLLPALSTQPSSAFLNQLPATTGSVLTDQPIQYPIANESTLVPVISKIQTTQPVVFLTIDDGVTKAPQAFSLMIANHLKASFFLVYRFINDNPTYFKELSQATGSLIENHTYDHTLLTNLNYNQQVQEICSNAAIFTQWYGRRPVLLRPPGGDYNNDTQRAAAACGMKAVIMWDVSVDNGSLNYQGTHHLQPGDIVLMHFRTTFTEDLQAFINAMNAQGLHTELLENWIN